MDKLTFVLSILVIISYLTVALGFIFLAFLLDKWWLSLLSIVIISGLKINLNTN